MFVWPAHLFNPQQTAAGVEASAISGGTSLVGDETIIQTDGGGRWKISFQGIDLRTPAKQRLWTAWRAHLAGGATPVLVPVLSLRTAHIPKLNRQRHISSDLQANDPVFPTAVSFVNPMVKAKIAANAALRATTVQIEVLQGGDLTGGETFGAGDRSYEIERVTGQVGRVFTCKIGCPLRAALAINTPVDFNWPLVQCRAVLGQDLNPSIAFGRTGTASISFVEDFSEVSA